MTEPDEPLDLETDDRFPSGPWMGFFLQKLLPGRHRMELSLTFRKGVMQGEGRDWVGNFLIRGRYQVEDGRCHFTKRYLGKHDVFYNGFNEGKGIWGLWEIPTEPAYNARGGFHIWPVGMSDPTAQHTSTEAEAPFPVEEVVDVEEREPVGVPG